MKYAGMRFGALVAAGLMARPTVASAEVDLNVVPDPPRNLGTAGLVDGSQSADVTPALGSAQTDADPDDLLAYHKIDDGSDFVSPIIELASLFLAQGEVTFTVGQAGGGGTYLTGSEGQELALGAYYWRVRSSPWRHSR